MLHHGVEQFPGFQFVFAGPATAAGRGGGVEQADTGGQRFAKFPVERLDFVPLEGLKFRDLLHVSEEKVEEEKRTELGTSIGQPFEWLKHWIFIV